MSSPPESLPEARGDVPPIPQADFAIVAYGYDG